MRLRNVFALPAALVSAAAIVAACSASDTTTAEPLPETVCVAGHQTSCECFGGVEGVQTCKEDGSGFDLCDCAGNTTSSSSSTGEPPPPCGNGICAEDENCHTCEIDCGICEPCTIAPKCDNATIPKPNPMHFPQLDIPKMKQLSRAEVRARLEKAIAKAGPEVRLLAAALDEHVAADEHPIVPAVRKAFAEHPKLAARIKTALSEVGLAPAAYRAKFPLAPVTLPAPSVGDADPPPGGTVECGAPQLRIGVYNLTVHEPDDIDFNGDEVYCLMQAESAAGAEIRLLPVTPSLKGGKSYQYSLESGVIWGQKGLKSPAGNMEITYDCIEQDSSDGYQQLLNTIGNAASQIGGVIPGQAGWVLTTIGALAPVVSGALGLNGDDHIFNAQQIITLDVQLQLTNGVQWSIRRGDDGNFIDKGWDWELFIQAWGCAEYGTL